MFALSPWPARCSSRNSHLTINPMHLRAWRPVANREVEVMMVPTMLDNKGTKILAKSLFKELRGNGYSANQILGLTTELIDLVTQDLRDANAAAAASRSESQDEAVASA